MNYPNPQYPQPGYPPQGQYPQPPQQPQYPSFPAQGQYPQPPQGQYPGNGQQPPAQPLAAGSIDEYYSQPSTGGGPSISWKDKPIGSWYAGIVSRDVTNADIQQQTNFQTKAPEFYRDGRPKFVMKVPLTIDTAQHPEFTEGEATLFVRGRMRDELVRAMAEAGKTGAPEAGAHLVVILAGKKPAGQGLSDANVFEIRYTPPAGGSSAGAPSPAPAPQQVVTEPAPAAAPAQQAQAPAPPPAPVQQQPAQPPAPEAPVQQLAVQQTPPPPAPSGMTPEQQQMLASITGQQAQSA